VVVHRVAEVLFIHTIRAHIASGAGTCKQGWRRAIFDPKIGAAVTSVRENVARPWAVESLAEGSQVCRGPHLAHTSRNCWDKHQSTNVTERRMQKAIQLLQQEDMKLIDVAKSVGYESDAAFSKAFKGIVGCHRVFLHNSKREEFTVMSLSHGRMSIHYLFHAEEIGVAKEPDLDRLVKVFVQVGEGIAARWVLMPKGMLLLVLVPDNPASGAIYLYDRVAQHFSLVCFEGTDDTLTVEEFDQLLSEYDLVDCAANPTLFRCPTQPVAMA
jgi:AraC-like DNA-binding protein